MFQPLSPGHQVLHIRLVRVSFHIHVFHPNNANKRKKERKPSYLLSFCSKSKGFEVNQNIIQFSIMSKVDWKDFMSL